MKFPPAREDTGNGGIEKEETIMISQVITKIQDELNSILDENQKKCLSEVLQKYLMNQIDRRLLTCLMKTTRLSR